MTEPIETLSFSRVQAPDFFPSALWEVMRPPAMIHVQGKASAFRHLERLPERGLAIVGSRRSQPRSTQAIREVLEPMRGFDWIIVSGLAKGVDAAAHEWALRLGFPTVAILGCGLRVQYPAENQALRGRILAAGGLVVTELPPDHEPVPWAFIHRNRLISGWSRATWVVQAGFRSGALNTASWALQQDRALFATPCFPGDPGLVGNQRLLSSGKASCAWGARSFGSVWLELEGFLSETLAAHRKSQKIYGSQASLKKEGEKGVLEMTLRQEIIRRTREEGGVGFTDLLGWALEVGWSPETFFGLVQNLVTQGRPFESENGILRYLEKTNNYNELI
jgi:DNA protecting protein DprA